MPNKLVVIINSLKVPKIKKILLYEMTFHVTNYSCLQNPVLCPLKSGFCACCHHISTGLYTLNTELGAVCWNEAPFLEVFWIAHCKKESWVAYCGKEKGVVPNLPALPRLLLNVMYYRTWIPNPYYYNVKFIQLGKLYVVKHNCVTWGVFNDYIMDNYMFRPVLAIFRLS